MTAENAELLAGEDTFLHDSPEGGNKTIGFGHKLNVLEKQTRQVYGVQIDEGTLQDAKMILEKDVSERYRQLELRLGAKFKNLDVRSQEMLVEMDFNVGTVEKTFPKFTAAVFAGDIEAQRQEYERYYTNDKGLKKPLERRNQMFYDRYLSDEALQAWENGARQ
jgi:GH24 family phage-related lysozyme (muramidase)